MVEVQIGRSRKPQPTMISRLILPQAVVNSIQLPQFEFKDIESDIALLCEIIREIEKIHTVKKSVRLGNPWWFKNPELDRISRDIKSETDPIIAKKLKKMGELI